MIDGTGKKIKVATEIGKDIELRNILPMHIRGEEEKDKFDFIVSRAVMPLPNLIKIVRKNISKEQHNALPNGVIVLKGGNLKEETKSFKKIIEQIELTQWFEEEWFKDKYILYLPC